MTSRSDLVTAVYHGAIVSSAVVVLLVYPAIYFIWKGWGLPAALPSGRTGDGAEAP